VTAKKPEMVHVIPYGCFLQSTRNHVLNECSENFEQILAVIQITLVSHPSLWPRSEIREYVFWRFHLVLPASAKRPATIAVLTGTVGRASKRSLVVRFTVSGPVPCVRPAWA
jgi:hypothetical protein